MFKNVFLRKDLVACCFSKSKCQIRLQMDQTRANRSLRTKCFKQAGPSYSYRRKEVGSLSRFL
ncbi:hypothetical protein ACS0TY_001898 [Phlomoides rotata]